METNQRNSIISIDETIEDKSEIMINTDIVKESLEDKAEDYLKDKTFTETFKIHYRNWIDIPTVDPNTNEKITLKSAFRAALLPSVMFAVR